MAEKGSKKAKQKPDGESVLASLPATRPNRMGRARAGAPTTAKAAEGTRARPTPAKVAEAAAKVNKPKAAKAAAKPAPKKTAKAAKAKASLAATPVPIAAKAAPKPKPVRSASQKLAAPAVESAKKRAPASEPDKQPSGTELVSTVVQAAGELASVGLSIGGQVLKRAVDRLPRP